MNPMNELRGRWKLYTDGGCLGNGSASAIGSAAWMVVSPSGQKTHESCPLTSHTGLSKITNNVAELWAVLRGLESIPERSSVEVVLDSSCIMHWIRKAMRRKGFNAERRLVDESFEIIGSRNVLLTLVKGHSGHTENEWCDRECSRILRNLPFSPSPPSIPVWHPIPRKKPKNPQSVPYDGLSRDEFLKRALLIDQFSRCSP